MHSICVSNEVGHASVKKSPGTFECNVNPWNKWDEEIKITV
ncbi:hypothetical protein SASC598P14_000330, partial [Snodgrassella alvi SCGC AB-598-P14]